MVCLNLPLLRHTPPASHSLERQSSTIHLALSLKNEGWLNARMTDIEDVLSDDFCYAYLLRFSVAEHSSENVLLLKAIRKYQQCPSSTEAREELAQCLLVVAMPGKLKRQLSDWAGSGEAAPSRPPPSELLAEATKQSYHVVKHDIFPRFQVSEYHYEMAVLHLSNMLQNVSFLSNYFPTVTGIEKLLAEFYMATTAWYEGHTTLASGWATEETIKHAKTIWKRYSNGITELPESADAVKRLNARIFEAPADLFFEAQVLALNRLHCSYEAFLDAPSGVELLKAIGLKRLPTPPLMPVHLHLQQITATGDNYAIGW